MTIVFKRFIKLQNTARGLSCMAQLLSRCYFQNITRDQCTLLAESN